MVIILVADGPTCQSMHPGKSSAKTKHENHRGCPNDSFILNRGLGCWFLLRQPSPRQSNVWKVETEYPQYFTIFPSETLKISCSRSSL